MPVTLAVVLAAVMAAAAVWALSRSPAGPDPVDPEAEERWLVGWSGAIRGSARSPGRSTVRWSAG